MRRGWYDPIAHDRADPWADGHLQEGPRLRADPGRVDRASNLRLGHSINFSTLGGCLASLLSDGLIVERKSGTFRRVKARESSSARHIVNDTTNGHPTMAKSINAKPAPSPIEKLSQLAQQALRMADEMRLMSSQIEQVASEEAAKLRQLHALLRSLG